MPSTPNPEMPLTRPHPAGRAATVPAAHSVPALSWVIHLCFKGSHAVGPDIRLVSGLQTMNPTSLQGAMKWYHVKRELFSDLIQGLHAI